VLDLSRDPPSGTSQGLQLDLSRDSTERDLLRNPIELELLKDSSWICLSSTWAGLVQRLQISTERDLLREEVQLDSTTDSTKLDLSRDSTELCSGTPVGLAQGLGKQKRRKGFIKLKDAGNQTIRQAKSVKEDGW
jgi:hypothetical protein